MTHDSLTHDHSGAIHDGMLGDAGRSAPRQGPATGGLRLRRPALAWFLGGALIAAAIGALAPTGLVVLLSGGLGGDPSDGVIAALLSSGVVNAYLTFVAAALIAAGLIGGPWLILARGRTRSRLSAIMAGGAVALGFAVFAAVAAALWGLGEGPDRAAALALGAAGAATGFGAPAGLLAGCVFAPLAFTRRAA